MNSADWKRFYQDERRSLGEHGLYDLLDRSSAVTHAWNAIIFPHTRLSGSGELLASAVKSVLASGCERVLALGVLHGGRVEDAQHVGAARAGDAEALAGLRRVHGPGTRNDSYHWTDEFSLDNFGALLRLEAERLCRKPPFVLERYPFLVGEDPSSLPLLDDLCEEWTSNTLLVATTDPVHHGVGYGTPADLLVDDVRALPIAERWFQEQLSSLTQGDYQHFLSLATQCKSDFRDVGPVLFEILRRKSASFEPRIFSSMIADYSDVLHAPQPTWVLGSLVTM